MAKSDEFYMYRLNVRKAADGSVIVELFAGGTLLAALDQSDYEQGLSVPRVATIDGAGPAPPAPPSSFDGATDEYARLLMAGIAALKHALSLAEGPHGANPPFKVQLRKGQLDDETGREIKVGRTEGLDVDPLDFL